MSAIHPNADLFERELGRRTLVSERWRAAILGSLVAVLLLGRAVYQGAHGFEQPDLPGRGYTLVALACWVALEWVTFAVTTRRIRHGADRSALLSYLGATLEVAMPTIALLVMCRYDHPLGALTSSITMAYFLVIILSPLQLDPWLCVLTGALAGAGYGTLVTLHWPELTRDWVGSPALMQLSLSMRAALLVVGGLAAAFVCQRIRTTLVETFGAMQERERVVSLFGQHVSPAVVNRLLSQPTGEHSELRSICVMVLDIRNFTTFSEAQPADEVVRYLNTLWGFMVHTVNEHHGIVNKFLGDGFLAIFGAPLSTGRDCANALAAARQILDELARLVAAGALPPTDIGIALHSGPAIVGNVGSADRKEYTVIGDVVNVAFRIEALNKEFGSTLLVSAPVWDATQSTGVEAPERLPTIAIRGRREPVELFRLA